MKGRLFPALALCLFTLSASGESINALGRTITAKPSIQTDAFGTLSRTFYSVPSYAAVPIEPAEYSSVGMSRWPTLGSNTFIAPLNLPTGALISDFSAVLCDTNAASSAAAVLYGLGALDDAVVIEEPLVTGDPATPGCVELFTILSGANYVIDNSSNFYVVAFVTGTYDGSTSFRGARVGYQLQVSPAPALATFADVPTNHGFFKFVEALAAAGITGGCGGGNYCPDAPLTRGQMAVFLSSALGLHWPD